LSPRLERVVQLWGAWSEPLWQQLAPTNKRVFFYFTKINQHFKTMWTICKLPHRIIQFKKSRWDAAWQKRSKNWLRVAFIKSGNKGSVYGLDGKHRQPNRLQPWNYAPCDRRVRVWEMRRNEK
jgi:hypothetical protein